MSTAKPEEFSFKSYFVPLTTTKAIHWIIIIGLLVYFNGLFNGFVGDDLGQVVNNNLITTMQNIPSFYLNYGLQNVVFVYYRPFIFTVFTLLYTSFGANPFAFHFFQLVLHIGSTIILFLFLKHFFKQSLAFILSLIFLVHPINSETVLYISYTQDILFFFFGMLSLWLLQQRKSYKTLIFANLCLLFSLFSKETGILFTLMAFVYSLFFQRKYILQIFISLSTVCLFYILLRIHAIGIFVKALGSPIGNLTLLQRTISMPAIVYFYLKTFFFPLTLASSYQWFYTRVDLNHFLLPLAIDLLFLLVLFFLGLIFFKKASRISFKRYLFFAIWLLSGIVFHAQIIALDQTVAERWFYFSIVGMLGMIGVLCEVFRVNLKNIWIAVIVIMLLTLLSVRTFIRTFDWRDEFTIASHDSTVSQDAWGLQNELSFAYFQKGNFKEAKIHAEKSIQLYPYKTNYLNLGAADFSLKDYKGAKIAFLKAIQLGDSYQAYDNLALLGLSYGDPKKNINFIKNIALKKNPHDGKLWLYLAALDYNFGNKKNAVYEIRQAYIYDPETQIVGVYNAIINNKPVKTNTK